MRYRGADWQTVRRVARPAWGIGIALLSSAAAADDVTALDSAWRSDTRVYVSAVSTHTRYANSTSTQNFLATTAELKFSSDIRPWSAGLFADYRHSLLDRDYDNLNLGGYFKYRWENWDATTFLFASKPRAFRHSRIYAGRLRYRVAANHKLGIVASGSFEYPESPTIGLGYFGSIRDSLSLNVVAGPGINDGPDFAAALELVWQVR